MTVTKAHDEVAEEGDRNEISARIDIATSLGIGNELGRLQRKQSIILHETKDEMQFEMRNLKAGTASANITTKDGIVPQNIVASSSHRKNQSSDKKTSHAFENYTSYEPSHQNKDNPENTSHIDLDTILPERTRLRRQRRFHANESLEETKEDSIERLNRLKERISGALSEVKGVLKQYSTDTEADNERPNGPIFSIGTKEKDTTPKDDELGSVQFRFIRKVRKRSIFNDEETNLGTSEIIKPLAQQNEDEWKRTENAGEEAQQIVCGKTHNEVKIKNSTKNPQGSTPDPIRNCQLSVTSNETPVTSNVNVVVQCKTDEAVGIFNEATTSNNHDVFFENIAIKGKSKEKIKIRNELINEVKETRRASTGAVQFLKHVSGTVDNDVKSQRRYSDSLVVLKTNHKPKIIPDTGKFGFEADNYLLATKANGVSFKQIKLFTDPSNLTNHDKIIINRPQNNEGDNSEDIEANLPKTIASNKESTSQTVPKIACNTTGVLPKPIEINEVSSATNYTQTTTIEEIQTASESINEEKTKKSSIWPMPNTIIPALPSVCASSLYFNHQQQRLQQHLLKRSEVHVDNTNHLLNENINDRDNSAWNNRQIITESVDKDLFFKQPNPKLEIVTKTDQQKFSESIETEPYVNTIIGESKTALTATDSDIDDKTKFYDHIIKSFNEKNKVATRLNEKELQQHQLEHLPQTGQEVSPIVEDSVNNLDASKAEYTNILTVSEVDNHCCSLINEIPNISAPTNEVLENKSIKRATILHNPFRDDSAVKSIVALETECAKDEIQHSFDISNEDMPDLLQTSSSPVQAPTIQQEALKCQHHVNKKKNIIKKVVRRASTEKVSNTTGSEQRNTKIILPDLRFSKGTVNKIRQNEIVAEKDLRRQHETTRVVAIAQNEEIKEGFEENIIPVADVFSDISEETTRSTPIEVVKKGPKIKKKVIIKRQKLKLSNADYTFFKENDDPVSSTGDANIVSEVETLEKAIAYVTDDENDSNDSSSNTKKNVQVQAKEPVKSCLRSREFQIGDTVLYAERYKKTQVRWKKGVVLERITSISYKLDIDGKEIPAHISYIKKFTDRKVNFGFKEYLEIEYEQVAEEERRARSYSIWNMV